MDSVKITQFTVKDFKGVELVECEVRPDGLFIIGGDCDQGKTSILDGIMAALGGERFVPASGAVHDGASKGEVSIETSNGLIVKRTFTDKGSYLTVTDVASGLKGNQATLNKFISLFALDCPQFSAASDKEKTGLLLKAIGVDLTATENAKASLTQERLTIGRNRDRLKAVADSMPWDKDCGCETISTNDLTEELETARTQNKANSQERTALSQIGARIQNCDATITVAKEEIAILQERVDELMAKIKTQQLNVTNASGAKDVLVKLQAETEATVAKLVDADEEAIMQRLRESEALNGRIRANGLRLAKLEEYSQEAAKYQQLTEDLKKVGEQQVALLGDCAKVLPGLGVTDGKLTFNGRFWDSMSHSDQLIVTVAICKQIVPACGFCLLDKIEALDPKKLETFARYCQEQSMQVIATRVSTGDECSIIIASGKVLKEIDSVVDKSD